MNEPLSIRVECYAGYRADERPIRFYLADRAIDVVDVLDRWIGVDHRYFKVQGADTGTYILRQDTSTGLWELTLWPPNCTLPR